MDYWLEATYGVVPMGCSQSVQDCTVSVWSTVESEGGHTPWIIGGTNAVAGSYVSALLVDA